MVATSTERKTSRAKEDIIALTKQKSYCRRGWNLLTAIAHQIRWRWRLYHFGWRSRLGTCAMLTCPKAISIAKRVTIRRGARLEAIGKTRGNHPKITIGEGTSAQFSFHCAAAQLVSIGKNVLIAGNVYITDHDHILDHPELPAIKCNAVRSIPVTIEDGVWLGEGCVILKGVTIGRRAVIGANAVVAKDIPSFSIAVGIPARVIRTIDIANSNWGDKPNN